MTTRIPGSTVGPMIVLSADPSSGGWLADPPQMALLDGTARLFVKTGGAPTDWTEVAGLSANAEVFSYAVVGDEMDLSNLVIPLPVTHALGYLVQVTQGTFTAFLMMGVPVATRDTDDFVLALSANATAGDTFDFVVSDAAAPPPILEE